VIVNVSSGLGSFWAVTNPERNEWRYPTIVYSGERRRTRLVGHAATPHVPGLAGQPGSTSASPPRTGMHLAAYTGAVGGPLTRPP
jgi:hypothetical protein